MRKFLTIVGIVWFLFFVCLGLVIGVQFLVDIIGYGYEYFDYGDMLKYSKTCLLVIVTACIGLLPIAVFWWLKNK